MSNGYYQFATGRVAAIEGDCEFPHLQQALNEPNGLIAIGGELSLARLLKAYQLGVFPWFSEGEPLMWWSPNPRMVLFPNELKIANSLQKTINQVSVEANSAYLIQEIITQLAATDVIKKIAGL